MLDSKEQVAYYHPSFSAKEQEREEWGCIRPEHFIRTRAAVRMYYRDLGRVIGASDGQETTFIYVEYGQAGPVHGRPITKQELREKGANL